MGIKLHKILICLVSQKKQKRVLGPRVAHLIIPSTKIAQTDVCLLNKMAARPTNKNNDI